MVQPMSRKGRREHREARLTCYGNIYGRVCGLTFETHNALDAHCRLAEHSHGSAPEETEEQSR